MADIDWRKVAARVDIKTEDCCGCNTVQYLTPEEAGALMDANAEERERLKAEGRLLP